MSLKVRRRCGQRGGARGRCRGELPVDCDQVVERTVLTGHVRPSHAAILRLFFEALAREQLDFEQLLAKAGRNDACPCGSGRKFKRCHGRGRRH